MSERAKAIAAGLVLYVTLVILFYGLHRLAFADGGGLYPIWYSASGVVFNALKAVAPGVVVGWLFRPAAIRTGAIVGAVGGLIEVVMLGVLTGIPFSEFPGRMTVVTFLAALTSAFTNAIGSAAGVFLREAKPSNNTPHTDARASPVLNQPPSARAGERGR
jgi:hypothetical protein